jgi:heat shock protein HslJ
VSIDELGRAAAAELRRDAAGGVDPAVKLRQLRRMSHTRTTTSVLAVVGALAALLVGALTSHDKNASQPATALNGKWYIAAIDGQPVTNLAIDLTISNGRLLGEDGCNVISGSTHVDGDRIFVRDLLVTPGDSACVGAMAPTARAIDEVLNGNVTWSIDKGALTLSEPGGHQLVYDPTTGIGVPLALADTTWALVEIDSSLGTFTSGYLSQTTIRFDRADGITITHRCYVSTGMVRVQRAELEVYDVISDKVRQCPSMPYQHAETQTDAMIDNALPRPATWSITGDGQLVIEPVGDQISRLTFDPA